MEREQLLAPEYYPADPAGDCGHDVPGRRRGPDRAVPRPRSHVGGGLRPGGLQPGQRLSAEAALKYFLIGAFASGFLLYGIALVYGATGTTNLWLIGARWPGPASLMAGAGSGSASDRFGFKVAAVPFHMWAPDVYDGAPTPVTAFMATGVKAAAFAALVGSCLEGFPVCPEPLAAGHCGVGHCLDGGR